MNCPRFLRGAVHIGKFLLEQSYLAIRKPKTVKIANVLKFLNDPPLL